MTTPAKGLSPENAALIERVRKGVPGYPVFPSDINEIINAARAEEREKVPADVVRLVIAAREVAFGDVIKPADKDGKAAIMELDDASEAFASRVPWEDEPPKRKRKRAALTPNPEA